MNNDWQTRVVCDFCRKNNVKVFVEDEWRTREMKVTMVKDKWTVIRHICYDSIPTLLPSALLNEMIREIPADKGDANG